MTNPKFCFDAWTIRQIEMDDIGHDGWDNDDSVDYQLQATNDNNSVSAYYDGDEGNEPRIRRVKVTYDDDNDDDGTSTSSSSSSDAED